jgi:RNA polymerase sigma-70 factor (family 1)
LNNFEQYQDDKLVQLIREEDCMPAFEVLYNRYWKKLLIQAKYKTGSEEDAEEIVQQVFLNIWKTRKNIYLKHTFYTYIASCVKYEILATLAKQKKQKLAHHNFHLDIAREEDNNTADWIDYESTRQQLEDTIQSLPEKCQLVFRLSRENGLSEKQISEHLSISRKTVEAHMTKALKALRTIIQQRLPFFF